MPLTPPPEMQPPPLVRDADDASPPRRMRSTADRPEGIDETGWQELRASGSAQPGGAALRALATSTPGPLLVVDLREESHGFLGDLAVSWYAPRNAGNQGRSRQAALAEEQRLLDALPRRESIAFDGQGKDRGEPEPARPPAAFGAPRTEAAVCAEAGLGHARLLVTDHHGPAPEELDRFVELLEGLPEGTWVHYHCRGGRGRTTTFLFLHDLLRNAGRLSLPAIAHRQRALSDGYDVLDAGAGDEWKAPLRMARAERVREFSEYARERAAGARQRFSEWLRTHRKP